jgi:hypothetical protein
VSSLDRQVDNRWNKCLDQLCTAWDRLGPDVTLSWLSALAGSQVTPEGVMLVEIAPKEQEPPRCICPRFSDTGGFRIADLCCPVHGVDGTDPGDGYWEDEPRTPVTDKGTATEGECA